MVASRAMAVPHNRIADISDLGIIVKRIIESETADRVTYPHRDNYYIFCLLKRGDATFRIDFEDIRMTDRQVLCIQPNQIHAFGSMGNSIEGFALLIDDSLVSEEHRLMLTEYGCHGRPAATDDTRIGELEHLTEIIDRRTDGGGGSATSRRIVREAAAAAVGIFVEAICENDGRRSRIDRRRLEIFTRFKELLRDNLHLEKQASRYADALHISTGYLNEIVKATANVSTSLYIRNETVLQSKRLLVYTSLDIGEIAARLGFDDSAYFTRMFTKTAGVSPTLFRKNYRE